ncbi:ABC transporter ATP-binding protein [Desulfobacula sp.]|uniref:ABC transporter ATP-binding protein n=1 Tax=Desulfobacula sp. TaxID=2593537 RepID=UPI0026355389|nr:ABC transporter ATP-binding protein [Desulfobacula sp.]
MNDNFLLNIENLHTEFSTPEGKVKAVDGLSFNISKGQTLGILGESGCGKSVTALSILGLLSQPTGKITQGRINFNGIDLCCLPNEKMRTIRGNQISMIFQEPMTSLNPVYTVGNQISEVFLTHQRTTKKLAVEQAVNMLEKVGIPSPEKRVNDYPHQLSGGMRQRVMIAMALACRPRLLIADEPTTALDVTIQAQILDLMMVLQEEYGMALMMITHDLGVISEVSDHVLVMYAGQVMEYASADIVFETPRHPYTKGILRSVPRLGKKFTEGKKPLYEIPGMVPSLHNLPDGCLFEPRCMVSKPVCKKEKPPLFSLKNKVKCRCWLLNETASVAKL